MVPLYSLGQDDQNEEQHEFFSYVLPMACHQHHIMPMPLSLPPLHSLGHNDQNEVQQDILGNVTLVAGTSICIT